MLINDRLSIKYLDYINFFDPYIMYLVLLL